MNEVSPAAAAEVQLVWQCHNYAADVLAFAGPYVPEGVMQWNSLAPKAERVVLLWCEDLLVFQMVKTLRNPMFCFQT